MFGKKFGVIFLLSVCLIVFNSGALAARPVNVADYFAVGDIGSTPDEIIQIWNYEYTSGPRQTDTFAVTLKGYVDAATGNEYRIYERDDEPDNSQNEILPYLECNLGKKSISILGKTRDGFNITSAEISKLESGQVFEGERYVWIPTFGKNFYTFYDEYKSYLRIVVIDKLQDGDFWFNTSSFLGIPYEYQEYRVLGYSHFAKGVGEFYHLEYAYDEIPDDEIEITVHHVPARDEEYELVSISAPTYP